MVGMLQGSEAFGLDVEDIHVVHPAQGPSYSWACTWHWVFVPAVCAIACIILCTSTAEVAIPM